MVSDPNFSTVKSPNPEEKETLNMGIQKAKESANTRITKA